MTQISAVTTVAFAIKTFLSTLSQYRSNINYVYDEGLSFETGVAKLRTERNLRQTKPTVFPLFIFRRSILRHTEPFSKRLPLITGRGAVPPGGLQSSGVGYRPIHGAFDLNFMYVHNDMSEIENFEITYLSLDGITAARNMKVPVPGLGDWSFQLKYGDLDDKTINSENTSYKAVTGTITIQGLFLIMKSDTSVPLIQNILLSIEDFNKEIYFTGALNHD